MMVFRQEVCSFKPGVEDGGVDAGTWRAHGSANKLGPPCVPEGKNVHFHYKGEELH